MTVSRGARKATSGRTGSTFAKTKRGRRGAAPTEMRAIMGRAGGATRQRGREPGRRAGGRWGRWAVTMMRGPPARQAKSTGEVNLAFPHSDHLGSNAGAASGRRKMAGLGASTTGRQVTDLLVLVLRDSRTGAGIRGWRLGKASGEFQMAGRV